jgi:hypothetical protein
MNSSTTLFPKTRPSYETRRSRISLSGGGEEETEQGGLAGLNATLGLVIHAMADGIALGASSLSEKDGLGFVVFLAVIVHKGEWDDIPFLLLSALAFRLTRPRIAFWLHQARPLSV